MEILSCPMCLDRYDTQRRIPRVNPTYGHTYCQACLLHLFKSIGSANRFKCPIGKSPLSRHMSLLLEDFPKTMKLLK